MARAAPRQPGPPAGVIFGCNRSSEEESLNGLFGMSSGHWSLVKEIIPGTPCFLFNFNTKVSFIMVEVMISCCGVQCQIQAPVQDCADHGHIVQPSSTQTDRHQHFKTTAVCRNCMAYSELFLLALGT